MNIRNLELATSVDTVLRLPDGQIEKSIPAIEKDSFYLHSAEPKSEPHPPSFLFPGVKRPVREADHFPSSTDRSKNA
jgi:hypothetical protein